MSPFNKRIIPRFRGNISITSKWCSLGYNIRMDTFQLRNKTSGDDEWITGVATKLWGSVQIISKAHTYDILNLPGIVGESDGKPVGFITFAVEGDACEIVALYCALEKKGLGTQLIESVKEHAKLAGHHTVWLMTTNDNTVALRFYQKRGFVITAVRVNVMEEQRKVKPTIPLLGNDGIPIRDEIELSIVV